MGGPAINLTSEWWALALRGRFDIQVCNKVAITRKIGGANANFGKSATWGDLVT